MSDAKIKFLPNTSRHLHPMVYFVADKPSKENISSNVPLVGTKSYAVLLSWCAKMNLDVSRVRFYNQCDDPFQGLSGMSLQNAVKLGQIKVVALGKSAFNYLLKRDIDDFFMLPHPSPRNRKINDRRKLDEQLMNCRDYIYGKTFETERSSQAPAEQTTQGQNEIQPEKK